MDDFLHIMKALSDETRLKMIDLLMKNDFCVGALSRQLGITEAAVSQHLKVLRNVGIVSGEKRGYYTHYDVNRELLLKTSQDMEALAKRDVARKACRQHITGDHKYCQNRPPKKN